MNSRNRVLMKIFNETQYKVYEKITSDKKYYKNLLK